MLCVCACACEEPSTKKKTARTPAQTRAFPFSFILILPFVVFIASPFFRREGFRFELRNSLALEFTQFTSAPAQCGSSPTSEQPPRPPGHLFASAPRQRPETIRRSGQLPQSFVRLQRTWEFP